MLTTTIQSTPAVKFHYGYNGCMNFQKENGRNPIQIQPLNNKVSSFCVEDLLF